MRNGHKNLVPSVQTLDAESQLILLDMLMIHEQFSLGQFLQAENSPASIEWLQDQGPDSVAVRLSLFAALCLMCGILGGTGADAWHGSKFMDAQNSQGIVSCIEQLQRLHGHSCQQIYWGYVAKRVHPLDLATETASGLCLARLACLCRVQTKAEAMSLQRVWGSLDKPHRSVLEDFFLADGISETAIIFSYLPLVLDVQFQHIIREIIS